MKKTKKGGSDGDKDINEIGFEEAEDPNEISNISYASNDDHEILNDDEIDLNSLDFENENENENENTDNESFATMSEFPSFSESDQNVLNTDTDISLSNSVSTTKYQSFNGGRKKRKSRKHKKTKKGGKSKKVKKNTLTKKSKKTKTTRTKSTKLRLRKRLRGGFIGDNGTDTERYGETNPYSVDRDSDSRF